MWFQNYHLIMYTQELFDNLDNSIDEYLLPDFAKREAQKNAYKEFYKKNLQAKNPMVMSVDEVCEELHEYLDIRFEEAATLTSGGVRSLLPRCFVSSSD
jgi:hypothetical protein